MTPSHTTCRTTDKTLSLQLIIHLLDQTKNYPSIKYYQNQHHDKMTWSPVIIKLDLGCSFLDSSSKIKSTLSVFAYLISQ